MESNSTTIIGLADTMTSKEQVLAIYPAYSYGFSMGGQQLYKVCVYRVNGFYERELILSEDYTEQRAWDQAWVKIQKDMLIKLEQ